MSSGLYFSPKSPCFLPKRMEHFRYADSLLTCVTIYLQPKPIENWLVHLSEVKENKAYVSAEYLKKAAKDLQNIKERSYQLMQIQLDSHVLDVGCGPASDTIALSKFIGEKGEIVGVDNDPDMIKRANLEAAQNNVDKQVKHIVANAQSLPFSDDEFDIVHADRFFQVIPKSVASTVFSEMNRVLKSNGRMVVVDTDWGSASVNFSDEAVERKLMAFFAQKMRPNGFAGRQLLELFKGSNYKDVNVELIPTGTRDFSQTAFGEWLIKEATTQKAATQKEMDQWNQELTEKTVKGTFLSQVNMIIVAGKKP
jgi:ubiquinone/menaquinone biosynthesis C-methylase UbiE